MSGSVRFSYACFKCHRSWKGGPFVGVSFGNTDESVGTLSCPECGLPGQAMGRNFKPPPRRALQKWELLSQGALDDRTMPAKAKFSISGRIRRRGRIIELSRWRKKSP